MSAPVGIRPGRPDRWTLAILAGCCGYVLLVAFVPGFVHRSPLVCLSNQAVGLHCPTCGLTRAFACLARLDPVSAVRFNPLVVFAAPFALGFAVDRVLEATGRRGIVARIPPAVGRGILVLFFACLLVVFVIRTASWLAPEWNPGGWLLPPAEFPH